MSYISASVLILARRVQCSCLQLYHVYMAMFSFSFVFLFALPLSFLSGVQVSLHNVWVRFDYQGHVLKITGNKIRN